METFSGFMAEFDKAMVLHRDVRYFGSVRDDLVELTIQYGELNHLEILVGGYDSDDRSLYEVPEVRAWVKKIHAEWPDSLFWLTPGSLYLCALCLNPGMHKRLPDGRRQIALDTEQLFGQFAASHVVGANVLRKAGVAKDAVDRASRQAQSNIFQMLNRKKLGDYVVVDPRSGTVLTYRREV